MKRLYRGYVVHSDGRIERKDGDGYIKANVRTDGYVHVTLGKDRHRLHRIVWEAFNGKIPQGMQIDHINDDKTDNTLSNLQLLTQGENVSKARRVVTDKQVVDIKYLKSLGYRQMQIAKSVGISQAVVSRVLNGKTYEWNI